MSRSDKRARVQFKGHISEDIDRAIYGKFAGHRCLADVRRALGLEAVVHEGEWSLEENQHKVEIERTRASLRVGKYLAGALRRGDAEELLRVAEMVGFCKARRFEAVQPIAYEILRAREEWCRKNTGNPTPRNLLFQINALRKKLGCAPIDMSLGALTMKMRRIGVDLKGRKKRIGKTNS